MSTSPVVATVDFEKPGIQHGFLKLPHSDERAAWGAIMAPVTVVKNGSGPTVLVTGANHGDEYEGPAALLDLCNEIKPEDMAGRLIMVPMMNYPAFCAGRRTSPLDEGNMNRVFPGRPDGTATEKMAHYFSKILIPMSDFVLDIHSGGKTLNFVPFSAAHVLSDKGQQARCEAAMRAFGAPYNVMLRELDSAGMYDTEAESQGKVFVSTELGGGGTITARSIGIARSGIINFCVHAGILNWKPAEGDGITLEMPSERCFLTAENSGLLEFLVDLGSPVVSGQLLARIHNTERTGIQPVMYHSVYDGLLIGRHHPGLIRSGDVMAVMANVVAG